MFVCIFIILYISDYNASFFMNILYADTHTLFPTLHTYSVCLSFYWLYRSVCVVWPGQTFKKTCLAVPWPSCALKEIPRATIPCGVLSLPVLPECKYIQHGKVQIHVSLKYTARDPHITPCQYLITNLSITVTQGRREWGHQLVVIIHWCCFSLQYKSNVHP